MRSDQALRPACPGCGKPVGVYEPLWQVHPTLGAVRTSWLRLAADARAATGSLWHVACAEGEGIAGG